MTLLECFDKHGCDKGSGRHRYDRFYEPIFEPIRNEPIRLLEIGIFRGASIAAWLDYFPNAEIIGVDNFERIPPGEIKALKNSRVSFWACDSTALAPQIDKVDFVIDDGSHDPVKQLQTLKMYRPLLKAGGMYVIEDIRNMSAIANIRPAGFHKGQAGEWIAIL
jgi:cephalosporin hydroxylase